jgi:hypothetical protein
MIRLDSPIVHAPNEDRSAVFMPSYLPDTTVLIDFGRDLVVRAKIEDAKQNGSNFLIAPPALIELVRGMIAGGPDTFEKNKKVFVWLRAHGCNVLELPRPFMAKVLRTSTGRISGVVPEHYEQLIDMVVSSVDFYAFLKRSEAAGSVWQGIAHADKIHETMLDRELSALVEVAKGGHDKILPALLSRTFGARLPYLWYQSHRPMPSRAAIGSTAGASGAEPRNCFFGFIAAI